ncbi:hypothetical protein Tco_1308759, partial [Tanacetum coccineum]
ACFNLLGATIAVVAVRFCHKAFDLSISTPIISDDLPSSFYHCQRRKVTIFRHRQRHKAATPFSTILKRSSLFMGSISIALIGDFQNQCVGFINEKGEEQGFDSKEDEVVPKVEDVSLVDGVFNGAFDGALGGDGDEDFEIREWEEAWVEAIEKEGIEEEDNEDDEENEGDDYLIKMRWINVVRHEYIDFGFQKVFRKMQECSWG